jgi:hypothetical protein
MAYQCEKHSKKEEALEKLKGGASFDSVAREFSEDKARSGMYWHSEAQVTTDILQEVQLGGRKEKSWNRLSQTLPWSLPNLLHRIQRTQKQRRSMVIIS